MAKVTTKTTTHITIELSAGESEVYEEVRNSVCCVNPEDLEKYFLSDSKHSFTEPTRQAALKLYTLFYDIVRK